jgi:predicted permease
MRWLDTVRMRLRMLFHRGEERARLDAELDFHIERQTEDNIAAGMAPEEARQRAMREFGNATVIREKTQETWSWTWAERLGQDVRFAMRQIGRAPGFATVAILTLALGIGANNAVFTLTHSLLLSTLPVQEPHRLVRLALHIGIDEGDHENRNAPLDLPFIEGIERHAKSFDGIFGWCVYDFPFEEVGLHGIHGAVVRGNTFQVLGVRPAAGRLLTPADDQRGGGPDGWAAVISHRLWVENYHSDPGVIGKHVTVTDHGVTIVGVAPQGFEGVVVAEHPDIYLPLEFTAALNGEDGLHTAGHLWLTTFARLKPGVSREQAAAEMNAIFPQVKKETMPAELLKIPEVQKARIDVVPGWTGWSTLREQYTQPLLILQLMVGAVLLICCANLSGLFLARASARQQEFAIRGALGAPRLRLMRQLLVESLMLALPGAGLGVLLAWWAGPWLIHSLGNRQAEVSLSSRPDLMVLGVTVGCALLCALLSGMAPAWMASRTSVEAALRGSNRGTSSGAGASVRRFFVPFQVAMSLALVVVAALLGSTVANLRMGDPGFRTENVIFALTDFNRIPQKGDDLIALYWRMAERMQGQPGVVNTSVTAFPPLLGWGGGGSFVAAGKAQHEQPSAADVDFISANYFSTVSTPLIAGRDLRNEVGDKGSCILNQAAAQKYFPQGGALGNALLESDHDFRTGKDITSSCQVIGIVADTKQASLHEAHTPIVYLPLVGAAPQMFFAIHARSLREARAAYVAVLHEMAPTSPETEPFLFRQQFSDSIAREQLLSGLSGFFAVLALLLSGIGIYGLVAWNVTQRTTEIGVRMALGATRWNVFTMVMKQVAWLLVVGVAAGGVGAYFAARSVKSFLYEVQAGSPAVFALSALMLVVIGVLAAMAPARRAVSIEPMQALRTE